MHKIYAIKNTINSKIYIGQTSNLSRRWSAHKCKARTGKDNYPLYNAIRKYGIENFTLEILESCNKDIVNDREKYFIALFDAVNNGYNISIGGQGFSDGRKVKRPGPMRGKKHSKKTKQLMSEQRGGDRNGMYGKTHSTESKQKMSKFHKENFKENGHPWEGRNHSDKTIVLISESRKGKNIGENNHAAKLTNEIVLKIRERYATENIFMSELAKEYNIGEYAISCIVKRKTWNHI